MLNTALQFNLRPDWRRKVYIDSKHICLQRANQRVIITSYELFPQAPQDGQSGDVKPVSEPEDTSPVKPANNSSGCVVS